MNTEGNRLDELGGNGGSVSTRGLMRYVAGCIKRERKRLAEAIRKGGTPDELASLILDEQFDERIFKMEGPERAYNVLD